MNKSNLMSKLVLGALVFSMATSQVSATDGAWEVAQPAPAAPNLSLPDAPAIVVGRFDSLKAFSGSAWNATKQYAGNAWDATKTYSGKAWDKVPNRPTWKSVSEAMPTVESIKAHLPETTLKNAGKGAAVVGGVAVVGLGGRYAWKRYKTKTVAPKVVAPVVVEEPVKEPAIIAPVEAPVAPAEVKAMTHEEIVAQFQTEEVYKVAKTILVSAAQTITQAKAEGKLPVACGFNPNEAMDALVALGRVIVTNAQYSTYFSGDRSWTGNKVSEGTQDFALQLCNGDAEMRNAIETVSMKFAQGNGAQAFNLFVRTQK